jgi:2,3-dihydroxybiphenyl 1,2-dioxygenase
MAAVRSLGYAIISARDLDAWRAFASDLLGLQVAEQTSDRLLLRMDEMSYRLDVRRADADGVTVLGWEVAGPKELDELAGKLEAAGYAVKRGDAQAAAERRVSGLVSFEDPDGLTLELFYGQKKDKERFVSPTGARFVTGPGGLGHAFQMVSDSAAYDRLYFDVLGFRLSDHIDFGPGLYGTFTHVNQRHHSFAWAAIPNAPKVVGHLMFEVDDIDLVGRAWDKVQAGAAPIARTFGKHSNDEMLSFYVVTPSGFQVEYGFGGKLIDEATWTPSRYDVASVWGHKASDPNEPEV